MNIEKESFGSNGVSLKYQCKHCGKFFENQSILSRHERMHTGDKPYKCPTCGKGFSQLGNLNKHIRTHQTAHLRWDRNTDSKPFKCPYPGCVKSFTAKASLNNHLATCHNNSTAADPSTSANINNNSSTSSLDQLTTHVHLQPPINSASLACLHDGCQASFEHVNELRQHLYRIAPGWAQEQSFLLKTIFQLTEHILHWEEKAKIERDSLVGYAKGLQESLAGLLSEHQIAMAAVQTDRTTAPVINNHHHVAGNMEGDYDYTSIAASSSASTAHPTAAAYHHQLLASDEGAANAAVACLLDMNTLQAHQEMLQGWRLHHQHYAHHPAYLYSDQDHGKLLLQQQQQPSSTLQQGEIDNSDFYGLDELLSPQPAASPVVAESIVGSSAPAAILLPSSSSSDISHHPMAAPPVAHNNNHHNHHHLLRTISFEEAVFLSQALLGNHQQQHSDGNGQVGGGNSSNSSRPSGVRPVVNINPCNSALQYQDYYHSNAMNDWLAMEELGQQSSGDKEGRLQVSLPLESGSKRKKILMEGEGSGLL